MAQNDKKAREILLGALVEIPDEKKTIEVLKYRGDYGDYVIIFTDKTLCLVREKLVDAFDEDATGDLKRELKLLIQRARKLDEYEYEDLTFDPSKDGGQGIQLNPENTDWI